jgi:hypothetical protein
MKKAKLILIFLLFNLILNAQEDNPTNQSLQVGVSSAFFGSGDITGVGLHVEYNYELNKYLSISPKLMSANANGISTYPGAKDSFHQISSFGLSLSGKITPFPNNFKRLKLDIGGLYNKFTKNWGDVGLKDEYDTYSTENTNYYEENLWGFLGSVSYNVIESNKLVGGVRFDLLTSLYKGYLECDGFQTGIYFGIKF